MFPLELSPLELLYFYDNRVNRPASFVIELELTGVPDKTLLEQAFSQACGRHPLLACRVSKRWNLKWHWNVSTESPKVRWVSEGESISPDREKIDLRKEVGIRCWIAVQESKTRVVLQFSHACTDGVGAYRFIGDWLDSYDSLCSGKEADAGLPELDIAKLPGRFDRLRNEVRQQNWFSRFGAAFKEGFDYVGPPIRRLHPRKKSPDVNSNGFPGVVSHSFSEEEHLLLKKAAGGSGFSVNDLLISELFFTILKWNSDNDHWSWRWRKRIRLSVPTDLRDQSDYDASASNMTATAFLTRKLHELENEATLRASVKEEILGIRDTRRGIKSIVLMDMLASLPFPAMWMSTRATCCYSAVFSNIGDPARRMLNRFKKQDRRLVAGNLVLDLITGVPPMRPDTNLAVSIFTYRRLLTISFRCDPALFSVQDTSDLLAIYTGRLRTIFEEETNQLQLEPSSV